jgi:hypothetical protein
MTRFQSVLRLRRLPWPIRVWRWLRNPHGPRMEMTSRPWRDVWFAALVPYRFRQIHQGYAAVFGFFWLPCPLCDKPYGGHEWRNVANRCCSVPDPLGGPGRTIGICPACTRAGKGAELEWPEEPR